MRVLLVNSYDRGGAAQSCLRLHSALISQGIKAKVLLKYKSRNERGTFKYIPPQRKPSAIVRLRKRVAQVFRSIGFDVDPIKNNWETDYLNSRAANLEKFSFPNTGFDITNSKLYQEADIINLHWVADFLDYESFFRTNSKPVVWTLHDMNPFSGGEHYEEIYSGIDDKGLPIKRMRSQNDLEVSRKIIEIKKNAILRASNLTIVAPSKWLAEEAKKSELFKGFPVKVIPYEINSKMFSPRDKKFSKELLGIPNEKKIILFVADSTDAFRKGLVFLKKAFEKIREQNLLLCVVGAKTTEEGQSEADILHLGPIKDEKLMSAAYSSADVFVIPSLMDNLPNTVIESLMCGTPVIGFPVGGIPEMIRNGENGYLTEDVSVTSLAESIRRFFTSGHKFSRSAIREDAIKKYNEGMQAGKYVELFKSIHRNTL